MKTKCVYNGRVVTTGQFAQMPRVGDFMKVCGEILKIEAILFDVGTDYAFAILYLRDIMPETKQKLKYV